MLQESMYHLLVHLQSNQVPSFCYIAQLREGLHLHFSGTKMDNLILQLLHYQYSKYLCPEIPHLTVLYISVLLLIKLGMKLNQTMPVLILKVRGDNYKYVDTYSLIQLVYQLKDHVLQTMVDVITSVLMSLGLYSASVSPDTSVLHFYLQSALVSHKRCTKNLLALCLQSLVKNFFSGVTPIIF